jgi:hypothetical protein
MLAALASGPGFRLVSSVEQRWMTGEPVVSDPAPIVGPIGPRLRAPSRDPGIPFVAVGAAISALGVWQVARARPRLRTRRGDG